MLPLPGAGTPRLKLREAGSHAPIVAMKLLAGSFALLGSILLAAAPALAQPPPPPVPMEEETATGGYPADLPGRPLLLPASQAEVDINFRMPIVDQPEPFDDTEFFDLVLLGISARYSLGTIEPFFGVDLAIYKPDDVDVLQTIFAGARAAVGPGALKGTFFLFTPGGDDEVTEIEVDGSYELKHKFNPQFAAIGEGGLAFYNASGGVGQDASLTIISLFGRGTGQVKVTPEVSLQAGLLVSVPVSATLTVDGNEIDVETESLIGLHGMGLYNVGKFDVYGRLDYRDSGDFSDTTVTVGLLARPMM